METLPPVEIVVSDAGFCPVLQRGDRMLYSHPGVAGERVCAQALTTLAPAAEAVALATAEGRAMQPLPLACPMEGCGAAFVLQVVGEDVARKFLTPVPPSRHESGEAGAGRGRGRAGRGRRLFKRLAVLVLLVALLAGAGLAGVAYFSPDLLPRAVGETLRTWGIPVGAPPAAAPDDRPRLKTDLGAAPAPGRDVPPAPPAAEKPDARSDAPPPAVEKPGAEPPEDRESSTAAPAASDERAGEPPENDRPPSDSPDGSAQSPGPPALSPPPP